MRRLFLVLTLLAGYAVAQPKVDSSQIKLNADGSVAGDAANALHLQNYRSNTAPASPAAGQIWCDTNSTPCIFKMYNGSTWTSPQGFASVNVVSTIDNLPAAPADGEFVYVRDRAVLYVYDSTAAQWVTNDWSGSTSISEYGLRPPIFPSSGTWKDVYTASVITAPSAAPTAATSATAGSTSAGNYQYKYTYVNANGGETTPSAASNTVAPGASKSNDLTGITTGGTGTVARRVYRTKTGGSVWYWCATISDNSTTTLHDGVADSALTQFAPDVNFSGAMPAGWGVLNTTGLTQGGCGTTSRSTMACMGVVSQAFGNNAIAAPTSDTRVTAYLDISSWRNFQLQYRVYQMSSMGDYQTTTHGNCWGGYRNGIMDTAPRIYFCTASQSCNSGVSLPFSGSVRPCNGYTRRYGVNGGWGGGGANEGGLNNPWPPISAVPFWVRMVKLGASFLPFLSPDNIVWSSSQTCINTTNHDAACAFVPNVSNTNQLPNLNTWEIPVGCFASGFSGVCVTPMWIEIDNFTIQPLSAPLNQNLYP